MAEDLQAFISYRRGDHFMRPGPDRDPDYTFIDNLKSALRQAGFNSVFVDTAIEGGEVYDDRIREELFKSDLVVAVIGTNWLDILRRKSLEAKTEKSADLKPDVLVQEIRLAINQEKEILPLLVDGAVMPSPNDLDVSIRRFHYPNALPVSSRITAEQLAKRLDGLVNKIQRTRKLRSAWKTAYVVFAVTAFWLCAIIPHIVGVWEFGPGAWEFMARVWSGFYIWPIIALPFTLLALYRPMTLIFEAVSVAPTWRSALRYITPLAMALVLTMLAITVEIMGEYEAPWSMHPKLAEQCTRAPENPPSFNLARFSLLAEYDAAGALKAEYERSGDREVPFWLKDRCWPNVFFYLVAPAYRPITSPDYFRTRPAIQQRFMAALEIQSSGARYSYSFIPYVISFSILIWLAATGIILSIFYTENQVRRPNGTILKLPSEDAYLCLTYAFVTLMAWVPFRINTANIKKIYFCVDVTNCEWNIAAYQNDIVLGIMFFIGYLYLTQGLLRNFQRVAQTVFGAGVVVAIVVCAVLAVIHGDQIAQMADNWRFYVRVGIVVFTILGALWFHFDPANIRRKESRL